jgi:hypothetical protein
MAMVSNVPPGPVIEAEAGKGLNTDSSSARADCRSDLWIRVTTTASVLVVAGIAAVVSFRHMHELSLAHGEDPLAAALIPLAVDGMIVTASMSLLQASRTGSRGGLLPWVMLLAGSLASLAANVAVAESTVIARLIAGWPSLALIGAYEMLMNQVRVTASTLNRRKRSEPGGGVIREQHEGSSVVTATRGDGRDLQRMAWRWAIANRCAEGRLPSGVAIAEQFTRSHRWGRLVKRTGRAGELE